MSPQETTVLTRWSRALVLFQAIGCASGPSFLFL
jgi:hypothetical protein